eukprot:jgi/Ulvmu1/10701/UM067_0027.1
MRGTLQVADMLIDEVTARSACTTLARVLNLESARVREFPRDVQPEWALQAAEALSTDAMLWILQAMKAPLPQLLHYLAATPFCPLALRALHPSIDTHATLALPVWPPIKAADVLPAIATLTHLHTLSLAGISLARLPQAPGPHLLQSTLSALPRLSSLSLHNTVLAPAAATLAAVLPQLPHLQSLDLSDNFLGAFFAPVAAALPTLPALDTLSLDDSLCCPKSLRTLAEVLPQLSTLTALSVGASEPIWYSHCCCGTSECPKTADVPPRTVVEDFTGLLRLAAALPLVPSLQWLHFSFALRHTSTCATVAHIGAVLGSLRQLQHLCVQPPKLFNLLWNNERRWLTSEVHGPRRWAGGGFSELTRLTSLDAGSCWPQISAHDMQVFALRLLPLTGLRSLRLPFASYSQEVCTSVWAALSQMTNLTQVAIKASPVRPSDMQPILELLQSVVTLPRVRSVSCPSVLKEGLGDPEGAVYREVAAAIAGAAEAGITVDVGCSVDGVSRIARNWFAGDAIRPALPLCTDLCLTVGRRTRIGGVEAALTRMTALTRLSMQVLGIEQRPHGWGAAGEADEEAGAGAVGGGPLEPVDGVPWRRLWSACGTLTSLRCLNIHIKESPAFACRDPHAESVASVARSVQHALACLLQLTELELMLSTACWGPFPARVLAACRGLKGLRTLSVELHDNEELLLRNMDEAGHFDAMPEGRRSEMERARAAPPDLSGVCHLTGLCSLSITGSSAHTVKGLVGMGLPALTALQLLRLDADLDGPLVAELAACVRSHLPLLRHLYVDGAGVGGASRLRNELDGAVRVHFE